MIIYIHGFGSSGEGAKAKETRTYFGEDKVLTPSLSYIPTLAMQTLDQIVHALSKHETVHLMGSSLGGYYALYLANKYNLKAVLINPSIKPYVTLENLAIYPPSYYDGSTFEWKQEHIKALKDFEVHTVADQDNLMQLLQTGDETLDYKQALEKLPHAKNIVQEGGSHAFDNFEDVLSEVAHFFR